MPAASEIVWTGISRLQDGVDVGVVAGFDGVPIGIIEAWIADMDRLQRWNEELLTCDLCAGNDVLGICSAHSPSVRFILQGRVEGIKLAWHHMSGHDDKSDDRLHEAAYRFQREYQPSM